MSHRVLVTGATGFIGRHALEPLIRNGCEVHALTRRLHNPDLAMALKPPTGTPGGLVYHTCDLDDPAAVDRLCAELLPTHLLHFAWFTEHGKYWRSPANLTCAAASLNLLHHFVTHGGTRAVFAGTCAEYEWSSGVCHEASTPTRPGTLYGTCKNSLREIVAVQAPLRSLSWAWGRIFFLYGPHEHPQRFVPSIAEPLRNGQDARCNFGSHVRDFLHVRDVAEAFAQLLLSDVLGPINIGAGAPVTLGDVARAIAAVVGHGERLAIEHRPPTADNPQVLVPDVTRLQSELGWRPRYDLLSGLRDVLTASQAQET